MAEPRISPEDVRHVARLARLALSEDELERMRAEMSAILDYMDKLTSLDTKGVEPTSHAVPLRNVLRADEPVPSLPVDDMLANAPDRDGDTFRVPRIIEE
jgi:aspartyl-tRNA(Asn)/glutamyl-tRNA(Gln) amidotransferase subunit C